MKPSQLISANILLLLEGQNIDEKSLMREDFYRADMIISGDKILKNRWGKYGRIVTDYEHPIDQNLRMRLLLDIWNEITKRKGATV